MNDSEFFLRTVEDLETRLSNPDYYNIACAAALVRKLLIDARPLAHLVNRQLGKRVKLAFRRYTLPNDGGWSTMCIAEPNANVPDSGQVDLDAFLSSKCFSVGKRSFTVKYVVLCCANIRGGVHFGKPDERKGLHGDDRVRLNPNPLSPKSSLQPLTMGMMAGIGRVVLDGLQPLVLAVRNQPTLNET